MSPIEDFSSAVAAFRAWAATVPFERSGEWECNYDHWPEIYAAFEDLVALGDHERWPADLAADILYAIARDNECQRLARLVPRTTLAWLAAMTEIVAEPEAKWQLAVELGETPLAEREQLLLRLVNDADEYVRRRALQALALIGSAKVTELALREWESAPETMPWTRMNALWALHRVGSSAYAAKLAEARSSTAEYLAPFAEKLAAGLAE